MLWSASSQLMIAMRAGHVMSEVERKAEFVVEPQAPTERLPWHAPEFMMTTETRVSNGSLTSGDDIGAGFS